MSVSYSIMEHLKVKRNAEDKYSVPVNIMVGQLAALASLMLIEDAQINKMRLVADGREYTFSGGELTPAFRQILKAMENAEELDFSIDYYFIWRAGWQMYELVGPLAMMDFFDEPGEEDLSNVFYCAWNNADCENGPGKLVAYGEHNGKTYSGLVELEQASSIPEGIWDEQNTPVIIDTDEDFDEKAYPELIKTCQDLADMASSYVLDCGPGLSFYLNNITIKTAEQRERYVELVKHLAEVAPDEIDVIINGAFLDCSKEDARLMTIEHDGHDVVIKVAEI